MCNRGYRALPLSLGVPGERGPHGDIEDYATDAAVGVSRTGGLDVSREARRLPEHRPVRILVMGAGAVGGFFGGKLAQRGHDVIFVARGAHLGAMRERGLELRSGAERTVIHPVTAVASPVDAASDIELVLFTVKGYDTIPAASALREVVGPPTAVLTLQNGVDSPDQLAAILGPEHVLAGTTYVFTAVVEPGIIETGPMRRIVFGELSGEVTPRVEAIADALRDGGIDMTVSADPRRALWEKFVTLAPNATITSACQLPVGEIRHVPEAAALYRALITEAVAVGQASGVEFADDVIDATLEFIMALPPSAMTSMQRDYERRHPVELEQLAGAVVRRGSELSVPTPAFAALYAVLKARALAFGGLG